MKSDKYCATTTSYIQANYIPTTRKKIIFIKCQISFNLGEILGKYMHQGFYFLSLNLEVKLASVFLKKISEQFTGRLEP